jgi:hypothetical protein
VKDYDISFVSTGDVLRKEIMAGSEVGRRAEAVVASGGECKGSSNIQPQNQLSSYSLLYREPDSPHVCF